MDDQIFETFKQFLDEKLLTIGVQLSALTKGQEEIRANQAVMKDDINSIKEKVNETNIIIDEDIRRDIHRIAEGHLMLAEKMKRVDDVANDVEEIKGSMVAIEAVVVKNRSNIIDLQNAKSN